MTRLASVVAVCIFAGCGRVDFDPPTVALGEPCISDPDCGLCGACEQGSCAALHFSQLLAGYTSTCGVDGHSALWCWGGNYYGELGVPERRQTEDPTPIPTRVPGVAPVGLAAEGWFAGAAVTADGTLNFWGVSGNLASYPSGSWASLSAGIAVTCGIQTDGTLWCWGSNGAGQCGQGFIGPMDTFAPIGQVGTDRDWQTVAAGDFGACAIKVDGRLFCWGDNLQGELGQGSVGAATATPTQVAGSWLDVDTGESTVCAIATDHRLWCWGTGLTNGLTEGLVATPTRNGTDADWMTLGLEFRDACALKQDGTMWCWGGDSNSELDQLVYSAAPVAMGMTTSDLEVGGTHWCVATASGWSCWGDNDYGQLGLGDTAPRAVPTPVCP